MSFDSSGIATVGAAAVTGISTVAVVGATTKAVGKIVGGGGGARRTRKSSNYKVFSGKAKHSKSFSVWK